MQDPKTALDAILETDGKSVQVKPLTVARYALMELAGSPFVTPGVEFTVLNVVPSLFVMTQDVSELRGYSSANVQELKDKALEWSEGIDLEQMADALAEIQDKVARMAKTAPSSSAPEGAKKKGSPQATA